MDQFLIGVASTLAGTAVLFLISKWKRISWLKWISGSFLFGPGIEYVYSSQQEAVPDIIEDIKHSDRIRIYTMRGFSFLEPEEDFSSFMDDTGKSIEMLIANPGSKRHPNPEVINRGRETKTSDPDMYRKDIIRAIKKVKILMERNKRLRCRLHTEPSTFRMILLNKRLYLSFFEPYTSGSQLTIYRIKPETHIYRAFQRLFEQVWRRASECQGFAEKE
jgi:hypothetical protein